VRRPPGGRDGQRPASAVPGLTRPLSYA
jgi:hypothetical protein